MIIGITGSIGSGKSVVSRILRCNGYYVYDCDSGAKQLMHKDESLKEKLIRIIGKDTYKENGIINKEYLSKIIFSDDKSRKMVNQLVHSAVRDEIKLLTSDEEGKLYFVESAILSTGDLTPFCEKILVIDAPIDVKIERVKKRDSLNESQIINRLEIQKNEIDRLPKNKIKIFWNDGETPILEKLLKYISNYKIQQTICLKKF